MKHYALPIIACIILFASCKNKNTLQKASIILAYIKYNDADIDSFMMKRYVYGTNFSPLKDSVLLDKNLFNIQKNTDTNIIYFNTADYQIRDDFDFEITNPYDQKTLRISNINYKLITYSGGLFAMDPPRGFSPIKSYTLNNVVVNVLNPDQYSEETIYTHK